MNGLERSRCKQIYMKDLRDFMNSLSDEDIDRLTSEERKKLHEKCIKQWHLETTKGYCEIFSSFICSILGVPEKEKKLAWCLFKDLTFNHTTRLYIYERFRGAGAHNATS